MPKHHFYCMNLQVILVKFRDNPGYLGLAGLTMALQDCSLILLPYPVSLEDPDNMFLGDMWYARPQLFFSVLLRPTGCRSRKIQLTCKVQTMSRCTWWFSALAPMRIWSGPMDGANGSCHWQAYEPSPTPILYVAPWCNVLGRVPRFSSFLNGNATPTIQHHLHSLKWVALQHGTANPEGTSRQEGQQCVQGQPLAVAVWPLEAASGGLSVSETEDRCEVVLRDKAKRAQATRHRC